MRLFGKKSRKYPIKYDEYGRSARERAFELFIQGYQPSQIFKQGLLPVTRETLYRYFEDWKKLRHQVPYSILRKYMKKNPDFSEKWIETVSNYLGVTKGAVILRMQEPWGIMDICRGKLPDNKFEGNKSKVENRLEAALGLVFWGERLHGNPPEQIKDLITQIVGLEDNTMLTISKLNGKIELNTKKL